MAALESFYPGQQLILREPQPLTVVAVYDTGTLILRTAAGATMIVPANVVKMWQEDV